MRKTRNPLTGARVRLTLIRSSNFLKRNKNENGTLKISKSIMTSNQSHFTWYYGQKNRRTFLVGNEVGKSLEIRTKVASWFLVMNERLHDLTTGIFVCFCVCVYVCTCIFVCVHAHVSAHINEKGKGEHKYSPAKVTYKAINSRNEQWRKVLITSKHQACRSYKCHENRLTAHKGLKTIYKEMQCLCQKAGHSEIIIYPKK